MLCSNIVKLIALFNVVNSRPPRAKAASEMGVGVCPVCLLDKLIGVYVATSVLLCL